MKLTLLLIPIVLLSSCTQGGNNPYYQSLRDECSIRNEYEQKFCNESVDMMEKNRYKKAEKIENKYLCPEGTVVDGIKAIGAIFYCRPE